jgi:prepilin-type N-terminal cleavage/methylation domain-containing protein
MKKMCSIKVLRQTGFSLIEVVVAVMVLAVAVPPTLNLLDAAGMGRADAINTTRATLLATSVLETVTADINSDAEGLGFEALADPSLYLDAPSIGLYARLSTLVDSYTNAGLSYSVEIGSLVSADGTVSVEPGDNIYRIVTVRVRFTTATTAAYDVPFSAMVSAL